MSDILLLGLRALADGTVERSGSLPVAGVWLESEVRLSEPAEIRLTARRSAAGGVQVLGRLDARVHLVCRRCLQEVEERFVVPLDFKLEPGLERGSEDEGVFPLRPDGDLVDLGPIVREELLLAIPVFPQCRPDCKGLCPRCGIDLNEETCECEVAEHDSRWDALRKLRA